MYTLAGLGAPIFDWWWTPRWRGLFFLLTADVLLFLVGVPMLFWSLIRPATAERLTRGDEIPNSGTRASFAVLAGVVLLAGAYTYVCTRPQCHQLMDKGDYYAGRGEWSRAEECYEESRLQCIEDGHSPAH